jgi:hypothetical protein
MRRILFVLLLALVVTPVALADEANPAAPAALEHAAATAPAEAPAEAPADVTLEELFAEIDPLAGSEDTYICMSGCTNQRDCEVKQEPSYCEPGYPRVCDNPTGGVCTGTCVCC